jgi:hypothetical protein
MQHHNQVAQAPNKQVINPKSYATYLTYMYIERVQIGKETCQVAIDGTHCSITISWSRGMRRSHRTCTIDVCLDAHRNMFIHTTTDLFEKTCNVG